MAPASSTACARAWVNRCSRAAGPCSDPGPTATDT
jgi:hypothetical protein